MVAGSIFTLMMNDGKQDALLNATALLKTRIDDIYVTRVQRTMAKFQAYFTNPANATQKNFAQQRAAWQADPLEFATDQSHAVQHTLLEISKTHKIFVGSCYKPYVAMAYSYLKLNEKAGSQKFSNTVTFTIPQVGTWIHDMVLHIKLSGLQATNMQIDKVKYAAYPGHRLLKRVKFIVNGTVISEYTSEMYNKFFQFHVTPRKHQGWLRIVGQEVPNLGYVTPDPVANEYREYRLYGDGPQTLKAQQPDLDMYIPLLFWFNLDVAQAFPNIQIKKGGVQVSVEFADMEDIVSSVDNGGGGAFVAPTIVTADLYVCHINTLPEIQNIMLQNMYFSLIRVTKTFEKILSQPTDTVLLKDINYITEHMAIAIRPIVNYTDIDVWYRNSVLTPVNLLSAVAFYDRGNPSLAINQATYYTETDVVDTCGFRINDIEIFQEDTVKKFSSFYPYAAKGINTPSDNGWLLFNSQFKCDSYDPSGHLDLGRNREVYFNYNSSYISDANRARMTVVAQSICFLTLRDNTANIRYI
jgi:hypothetical protein